MKINRFSSLLIPLLFAPVTLAQTPTPVFPMPTGGNACVTAKKLGSTLAIEWATGQPSISSAIEKAKGALRAKGHTYTFPQANSPLAHGWMVVVKTGYTSRTGRSRTSYGCGFAADAANAEQLALKDLRSYSWGWIPAYGYEVIEKKEF